MPVDLLAAAADLQACWCTSTISDHFAVAAVDEAEVAADYTKMEKAKFASIACVEGLGSEHEAEQSFALESE